MIDYVDGLIGRALDALRETGQFERTAIVATADHGDMLGERGLWYKMTFFERAVRVPLVFTAPAQWAPRRVPDIVSLADLYPTLRAMAGLAPDGEDGADLLPLIEGRQVPRPDAKFGEYMAEGTTAPIFMIRRGRHKYIAAEGDPPQLFDLDADPDERRNLADDGAHRALARDFAEEVAAKWDGAAIARDVRASQRRRLLVQRALNVGRVHPWDFEPAYGAAGRYYRNRPESRGIERRARIPAPRD
jgi:choline-sulfatase